MPEGHIFKEECCKMHFYCMNIGYHFPCVVAMIDLRRAFNAVKLYAVTLFGDFLLCCILFYFRCI